MGESAKANDRSAPASRPGANAKSIAPPAATLRAAAAESALAIKAARAPKEASPRPDRITLSAEDSAALRDQLVADLDRLRSSDEAADWVHKNLSAKNTLTSSDADLLEAIFREKLATVEALDRAVDELSSLAPERARPHGTDKAQAIANPLSGQRRRQSKSLKGRGSAVAE